MGFLNSIGIEKEAYENAKDTTVTEGYEAVESGAYEATIKNIILYKFTGTTREGVEFETTKLRIEVELKDNGRVITYRSDVGKTLKDGSANEGFLARLKSIGRATNFDIDKLKPGEKVKVSSYGKEYDGQKFVGVDGKSVIALVRKVEDENQDEDSLFRFSNELEGITRKGADDIQKFLDKVERNNGIFKIKKRKSSSNSNADTPAPGSDEAKEELEQIDF